MSAWSWAQKKDYDLETESTLPQINSENSEHVRDPPLDIVGNGDVGDRDVDQTSGVGDHLGAVWLEGARHPGLHRDIRDQDKLSDDDDHNVVSHDVTDDDDVSDDPVGGLGESHRDSQLVRRERDRQLRRGKGHQARPIRDQQQGEVGDGVGHGGDQI